MHVRRSNELLILLAIRCKGNTTMEENLQVWPYFFQMLFAGKFHDTYQYAEHPAWNTRDISNILIQGFLRNTVALHLKVAQESSFFLRHTYQISKRIDVFDKNSAQIAHQTARNIIVRRMATAENQTFTIKKLTLRIITQIESYSIKSTSIMNTMQTIMRNGNKFTLIIGSTRRFSIPFYGTWP